MSYKQEDNSAQYFHPYEFSNSILTEIKPHIDDEIAKMTAGLVHRDLRKMIESRLQTEWVHDDDPNHRPLNFYANFVLDNWISQEVYLELNRREEMCKKSNTPFNRKKQSGTLRIVAMRCAVQRAVMLFSSWNDATFPTGFRKNDQCNLRCSLAEQLSEVPYDA